MRRRLPLLLLLAAACRPPADRPAARPDALSVVDDAGRTVALAAPARRIVSLAPSTTEILFAIGAGDRLVGRTTWCKFPPEAEAVPAVGDGLNPNIEAVAARRPDLVVLYRSRLNETAAEQLARLGIPAVILRQDRLEDVARDARLLGQLTGQRAAGDSLARSLEAVAGAPVAASGGGGTRLAFVVWDNPPTIIGAGSFLDQIATLAGGVNVFHDISGASATVALETLAARNPDVIVLLAAADTEEVPGWASRREWQAVRAVRERHFVVLPEALYGRPGPRAGEAVADLRRRLARVAR